MPDGFSLKGLKGRKIGDFMADGATAKGMISVTVLHVKSAYIFYRPSLCTAICNYFMMFAVFLCSIRAEKGPVQPWER